MYVPAHFAAADRMLDDLLAAGALSDLISHSPAGLESTPLPLIRVGDTLHGHVARNNTHWQAGLADGGAPALVIVRGADAYVSPGWYVSKREHGRVVPTWNYQVVHVHGRLIAHPDTAWTEALVRRLTELHEAPLPAPWSVDDAPPEFIAGQLRAIVGVEVVIERIEAKAKLSQNRTAEDAAGVVDALGSGSPRQVEVADAMRELPPR